jgi:DNA-binding NtrC family response regulator
VYSALDAYLFPGNIRELENLIDSFYVFCVDAVNLGDLPGWLTDSSKMETESTFNWTLHERQLIERALLYFDGNKSKVHQALGYGSVNTLIRKMKEYNINSSCEI